MLVGFAAAGRAGKASTLLVADVPERVTWDDTRDGPGEGRGEADAEAHGVDPGLLFATRITEGAPPEASGGNALVLAAEPQLLCLFVADREDCAVELFSFKTLEPPAVTGEEEAPLLDPGREG